MTKGLYILFASMFIVMSGYGLTLTVLPFYIERMALGGGATSKEISVHVGALTGVFALMQFFFAPLWGAMSDKIGRRPLFFAGLGGNAVFNVLFGLGSDLVTLYVARILNFGSGMVGVALILLMLTETMTFILFWVGVLAFGMALLIPTLATLASRRSETEVGTALGLQSAANSLGQFAGPVTGGFLFVWSIHIPYLSTAVPLLATAIFLRAKVFLERGRQDGPHFD